MKETLSIFITTIILVLLIVVFPLYNYFERQDDMSYNLVLKATTSFIDEVIYCGYISQEMYTDYISEIANTGNLYDIELEAHKKVLVQKDGSNEYEEQYLIDYNNDIFSTQVTNTSNINDKVIKNGVYQLNVGDKIYVKLKNSSITMAGALFNIIVPTSSPDTIKINYGGIVENNTWKQADTPLFEEFQIKLAFDLNTNGNNNASYNSDILKNGIVNKIYTGSKYTTFTIPNVVPTRTNCAFKGWSTSRNGKVVYNLNDKVKCDESLALYAVWDYKPITLTLNANGGTPATQSKTITYGKNYTALSSVTNPTMSGYSFDGWYTAPTGGTKVTSNTSVNSTNNVTLYAHWKAVQMNIKLDANGGSVSPSSFTGTYKQKYNSLPNPTRTGYDFIGWYLDSSYSTKVTNSTTINTSADHMLYAKWDPKTYTINFNGNGGTSTSWSKKYDQILGTLPSSTRKDYVFDGWYTAQTGGTKISKDTVVKGNVIYYAHWQVQYTAPTTPTITVKDTSNKTISSGSWSNKDLTITIGGSTAKSGTIKYQYSYDNKNWYNYTGSIKYSQETSGKTIYARAYIAEKSDKRSSNTTYNIKLDKTAPTISNIKNSSNSNWTNQNVTISFNYNDNLSGVNTSKIVYSYDKSKTYNDLTLNESSKYVSGLWTAEWDKDVYFKIIDNAGNESDWIYAGKVRIDKTKPTISNIYNSSGGNWTNKDVTISFNYDDSSSSDVVANYGSRGSGVNTSKIVYSYDKVNAYNDFQNINGSSKYVSGTWSAERDNYVYLKVTDNAGNESVWYPAGWISIDKTPPYIANIDILGRNPEMTSEDLEGIIRDGNNIHILYNNNRIYSIWTAPFISSDFSDNLSGVKYIDWGTDSGDLRYAGGQRLERKIVVTDKAGNSCEVRVHWYGNKPPSPWPY